MSHNPIVFTIPPRAMKLLATLVFAACVLCIAPALAQKPELVVQTGHTTDYITHLAFSPDGKMLATSALPESYLRIWHTETGKLIEPLQKKGFRTGALLWSNNYNLYTLPFPQHNIIVWNGVSRKIIADTVKLNIKRIHDRFFPLVSTFSPDGHLLAAFSDSMKISERIWKDSVTIIDVNIGKVKVKLPKSGNTHTLFTPNSQFLLLFNSQEITLWNAKTFEFIRTIDTAEVGRERYAEYALAVSTDSKTIAVGMGDTTICVWDIHTGQKKQVLKGHTGIPLGIAFTPKGQIVSVGRDSTIKVWDANNGNLLRTIANFPSTTASVSASPDGKTIAMTTELANGKVYLVDIEQGVIKHILGGNTNRISDITLQSEAKKQLTVQYARVTQSSFKNETVTMWDYSSLLKSAKTLRKKLLNSETTTTTFLDGSMLVCEFNDSLCVLWQPEDEKIIQTITLPRNEKVEQIIFTKNFSQMALILYKRGYAEKQNDVLRVFEIGTGKQLWVDSTFGCDNSRPSGIFPAFSPDNTMFLIATTTPEAIKTGFFRETLFRLTIFDAHTGKKLLVQPFGIGASFTSQNTISKRFGKDTTINPRSGLIEYFSFTSAKNMDILRLEGDVITTKAKNNDTIVFHIPSQHRLSNRFALANNYAYQFSKDGKFALSSDGIKTSIIDATTGKDLCNLYTLDSTNWAVTTPDGRFDGSEGGLRYLHFVVGNEPIELEQLKERYYEPGLLSKLMGYNKEPLREIERFESVKLYPRIEVQQGDNSAKASTKSEAKPDAKPRSKTNAKSTARSITPNTPNVASNLTFSVKLTNQGGGFGRVPVWLNGKELTDDARPQNVRTDAADMAITLNLEGNRLLLPGTTNTLEVRAFNAENAVLSRSTKYDFQAPGERLQSAPHLYAIVGGTSDYQGEELDLPFAAADAEQIAKAVRIAGERLLGADRVHITLLTSKRDSAQSKTRTTKANIVAALKEVQTKSTANDILFVYLTGHGINWGGQDGDWYYLTTDARLGDDEKFTDAALRTSVALSSRELTDLMKAIPARKQTLALDACASGKAVENLLASRDVPSSQLRAMMRMKDRAGLHVISGCASNAVSYEASRYGQGLLTYSLLMGMKGGALRDNQFVDVKQLFEFAADRVPELARDIGRVQKPQVCSPFGGGSFDIGLITEAEAKTIPLADAKPLFVRANFQDEKKMYDHLNVGKRVNEALRGVTYRAAMNPFEAWLVYLDAPEFPGAYSLNGRYSVKGDDITLSAVLRRGEEEGMMLSVKGTAANLPELTSALLQEVRKRIQ